MEAMSTVYQVVASPDGAYWHVEVPALSRVTQAKSAAGVAAMARDLIEIMTGETKAELVVDYQIPSSVRRHLDNVEAARTAEVQARREAAAELRAAARELRDSQHLTLKDIGAVLGVSYQRAHQLIESGV